jgi:uncharacterized protein (TIGR03000 family)
MRRLSVFALLGVGWLTTGWVVGQETARPVHLTFVVPEDAQVWVEGASTSTRGPVREFTSPALSPGQKYVYTVRVRWQRYGQTIDQKQDVSVKGGDYVELNYAGANGGYTAAPAVTFGQRNVAYYYSPGQTTSGSPYSSPRYPGNRIGYYDRQNGILSYYGATPGWGTADTTGAGAGG